jgi:hypothetical protein
MRHFKDPKFKPLFDALPRRVQDAASRSFQLLKQDPRHPSLHFKRINEDLWSVRVGRGYRALALEGRDGCTARASAALPTSTWTSTCMCAS